ncbi:MAG: response regulator, partial [bacterium]
LETEGYEVITAADSQSALKRLREKPVHVVVYDLAYPDNAGLECLQDLVNANREVKVMIHTAYAISLSNLEKKSENFGSRKGTHTESFLRINFVGRSNSVSENNSEEIIMFMLNDFFAYLLLSFMLLAIALAFWLRFTWFPTLPSSRPPAKEDNGASKSSPDLLKRHYDDGVISRATYETGRGKIKEAIC